LFFGFKFGYDHASGICLVCWAGGSETRINVKKVFKEGLLIQ